MARKIRQPDAFAFVVGEYNWGVQPSLKNPIDHFLEEWFWRPAVITSYSAGRTAGVRAALAWCGVLSEMGMVVVFSTLTLGLIEEDDVDRLEARPLCRLPTDASDWIYVRGYRT
ncbi:NAD(P)H-dependent FMN reductase [Bradyrhizobium sp. USDA 10063]